MEKTLEDLIPPSGAVPKGSGDVLLDLADKMGITRIANKTPGLSPFVEGFRRLSRMKGDRAVIEKAVNADPQLKKIASHIAQDLVELSTVLGIGYLREEIE